MQCCLAQGVLGSFLWVIQVTKVIQSQPPRSMCDFGLTRPPGPSQDPPLQSMSLPCPCPQHDACSRSSLSPWSYHPCHAGLRILGPAPPTTLALVSRDQYYYIPESPQNNSEISSTSQSNPSISRPLPLPKAAICEPRLTAL